MTESCTLSLFVYSNFLCYLCRFVTVCTVKKMWTGGYVTVIFTSCPSKNTFFRQSTKRKKRTEKSRKHLLWRDSDPEKICRLTPANFFVGDKSHLRWQVPFHKLVNLTTWLDNLTCVLPSYPSSHHLTSYNLSSWFVKSTCIILISRKCRTMTNPTWGDIFKSSKLKERTSFLPCFNEKKRSSFELWAFETAFENITQSGIGCITPRKK